jgi:glutamyl/glutaminyl-tRNA synthetase
MVRVRFAPSATGYLHIGSAIFSWLLARRKGGALVLHIEDTDPDRNTDVTLRSIYDGLNWLDRVLRNGPRAGVTGQIVGTSAYEVSAAIGRERAIAELAAV